MPRAAARRHTRAVNPSTSWGGIALIVAVGAASSSTGCSSVLGLDDFTEAEAGATTATGSTTSTGDATTTTGTDTTTSGPGGGGEGGSTTTSTSSAGGGGSGGAGGGGVTLSCVAGSVFEVFTTIELAGFQLDDDGIVVVSRPNSNRVHVGFPVETAGVPGTQVVARTIRFGTPPDLAPVAIYPSAPDNVYRRVVDAYTTPDAVHFWGDESGRPGEWVFPADEEISPNGAVFRPYPMPPACTRGERLSVHQDEAGVVRFAATCTTDGPGVQAYLYVGTPQAIEVVVGPVEGDFNGDPPDDLSVLGFGRAAGRNIVYTGGEEFQAGLGGFLRTGNTTAELSDVVAVVPPTDHALRLLRGPEVDGRLFMGALHIDPSTFDAPTIDGAYRTGSISEGDVAALAADPVATLPHAIDLAEPRDLVVPFIVRRAGSYVVGAGVTSFDDSVPTTTRVSVWSADGEPLVESFQVAEASSQSVTFLAAGAASAGFGSLGVAWSELTGDAYRVRGASVQCLAE